MPTEEVLSYFTAKKDDSTGEYVMYRPDMPYPLQSTVIRDKIIRVNTQTGEINMTPLFPDDDTKDSTQGDGH